MTDNTLYIVEGDYRGQTAYVFTGEMDLTDESKTMDDYVTTGRVSYDFGESLEVARDYARETQHDGDVLVRHVG